MSLVPYEPPLASAAMVLKSSVRSFILEHGGAVTIHQEYGAGGARTGSAVWDASFVLADYVDRRCRQWERNSSVIELGAGLGLVSIAAARCGMDVLATDGDAAVLPSLERNALDESVRVAHLDWDDDESLKTAVPSCSRPPDVILASDVIFLGSHHAWRSLIRVVSSLCQRRRQWFADEVCPAHHNAHATHVRPGSSPWAAPRPQLNALLLPAPPARRRPTR